MVDHRPSYHAKTLEDWRAWLLQNHHKEQFIWLIIYHKESETPSVYYDEAVDEALCFGWIDSKPNKRDQESYFQFFSKRNPKSNWSKVNKVKVARLIKENRMHESGLAMVEEAKKSGTWDALNDVDNLIVPNDLQEALKSVPKAAQYFDDFPKSVRRGILEWIFNAKKPETRKKRIEETASLAGENIRANQYRQPKSK